MGLGSEFSVLPVTMKGDDPGRQLDEVIKIKIDNEDAFREKLK